MNTLADDYDLVPRCTHKSGWRKQIGEELNHLELERRRAIGERRGVVEGQIAALRWVLEEVVK